MVDDEGSYSYKAIAFIAKQTRFGKLNSKGNCVSLSTVPRLKILSSDFSIKKIYVLVRNLGVKLWIK